MEYEFVQLGSVCTFENGDRGKNYPNEKDFTETGIPFVNGGHIINGKIDISQLNYISEQKYSQLRAGKASRGDILFSLRGSLGKCVRNPFEKAAIASALVIVRPNEKIDRDYLFYVMNSPFFVKQGENNDNGSVQINLSVDILKSFSIPLPSMEKQKKIAFFLDSIDKKIDNNNVIAAELEGMAKDLYDYWFVQFDFPDENGKPYKSSGGKMVWNEELKREIPEGWEVDRLGKVCDTLLGGTPDTENALYWNGDIPWLNSGEVATSPVLNAEKTITKEGLKNSATSFASAGAVVMSITRYIRPSILGIDACFNQSVIAVIPNEQIHSTYLYLFMLSQVERYMRLRTGAQQPHINKETVDSTLITLPVDSVLNQFYDRVEPLFERQMIAMKEAKELESLRDFLLPMLMNGQVKVKGA